MARNNIKLKVYPNTLEAVLTNIVVATMAFSPPARSGKMPFGYSKQVSRDKAGGLNADVPKGCSQKARQRRSAPWHRRPSYDLRRAPSCRAFWLQRIP